MSASAARFRTSYVAALRSHLDDPSEATLRSAYELGRDAVASELSVLDLAALHHDALRAALSSDRNAGRIEQIIRAAADFYLESLAASEMVQRGFREAREAAQLERRHAALLRSSRICSRTPRSPSTPPGLSRKCSASSPSKPASSPEPRDLGLRRPCQAARARSRSHLIRTRWEKPSLARLRRSSPPCNTRRTGVRLHRGCGPGERRLS